MRNRIIGGAIIALLFCCGQPAIVRAGKTEQDSLLHNRRILPEHLTRPVDNCRGPAITNRLHTINQLRLNVTNWGALGSMGGEIKDPITGEKVMGAEYPAGSNIEYLKYCALWVGAVVGSDTAVSTAYTALGGITEFYPGTVGMEERSTRIDNYYFHEDAVSEQDFVCEYADTLTYSEYVPADFWSYRPHRPLNIRIHQESFAWSYEYAEDFEIIRYWIVNIGDTYYSKVYVGFLVHPQVGHVSGRPVVINPSDPPFYRTGYHLGFARTIPSLAGYGYADTMNIMWLADNDGDPISRSRFGEISGTSVLGFSIIGTPLKSHWDDYHANNCWHQPYACSFNWWNPSENWGLDWGPQYGPRGPSARGGLGEPLGDRQKYRRMASHEIDYDQMWTAKNFSYQGWIGPPLGEKFPSLLARGEYQTVGLLAAGQFELPPGDSIPIVLAVAAGKQFHTWPDNLRFLPNRPEVFYDRLDFSDLAKNMQWAKWIYDNPALDTDGDGCRGNYFLANCTEGADGHPPGTPTCDTVFYSGDGVADLAGLASPPSPQIRMTTEPGCIHLAWEGENSETNFDHFSQRRDFEGYNVYLGLNYRPDNLALVGTWDRENYDRYRLTAIEGRKRWIDREPPFTPEQLQEMYGSGFDQHLYPDKWSYFEDKTGTRMYFHSHSGNRGNQYVDHDVLVQNSIQRVGIDSLVDELNEVRHYYGRYECTITGLLLSQKYYVAVTAYDHGFPEGELDPLESSVLDNMQAVYPLYPPDSVRVKGLNVVVYPNPYRIDAGYRVRHYEDPNREGFPERMRRINFTNLPPEATIKIFSLDGDLIRELQHPDSRFSDSPSHTAWDVISRNTQAVVSGIYLYSVESAWGNQVGKLVIIK